MTNATATRNGYGFGYIVTVAFEDGTRATRKGKIAARATCAIICEARNVKYGMRPAEGWGVWGYRSDVAKATKEMAAIKAKLEALGKLEDHKIELVIIEDGSCCPNPNPLK